MVAKGQSILSFLPLLSPERDVLTPSERVRLAEAIASLASTRIEVQGQVESAKVKVEAAKVELNRTEQLLRDKVGNARAVDDAKAKHRLAEEELDAAKAREALLAKTSLDAEAGTLSPNIIESPEKGVLQNIHVAVGQMVAAGAPLFEIMNPETMWIRVPVYVGDLELINTDAESPVSDVSVLHGEKKFMAKPIAAPPSANPDTVTVNLFYELDNTVSKFLPGQRVAVTLELNKREENLVIPWAAVLHDIHGDTWVYQKVDDRVYRRNRVLVQFVKGEEAVLANGPARGTLLVTDGVAELFGTEFGNSK